MRYPRLKDLREDHELMQKQVAAALGIDQRVYSNYETGKREIPVHHLVALADLYHTSGPLRLSKTLSGGLEGPQVLQNVFVSPGFAGRAGSMRPWAQTFLIASVGKGRCRQTFSTH